MRTNLIMALSRAARSTARNLPVGAQLRRAAVLGSLLLAGCNTVLLHPSGDVAAQQRHLLVISTGLMLLIIVPVIALTLVFAWRYRAIEHARQPTSPSGTIPPSWSS